MGIFHGYVKWPEDIIIITVIISNPTILSTAAPWNLKPLPAKKIGASQWSWLWTELTWSWITYPALPWVRWLRKSVVIERHQITKQFDVAMEATKIGMISEILMKIGMEPGFDCIHKLRTYWSHNAIGIMSWDLRIVDKYVYMVK